MMASLLRTTYSSSLVSMLTQFLYMSPTMTPSSATLLRRSTVADVVDSAILPLISNGTCYQANNMQLNDHFIPCGNILFGDQACCQTGDICLESSACYNNALSITYIAGCTDKAYGNTTVCPSKSLWKDYALLGVAYVGNNTWAACPPDDSPKAHLQKGTPVACDSKKADSGSAVFNAGDILNTVGILPRTPFGCISTTPLASRDDYTQADYSSPPPVDEDSSMTSKDGDISGEEPFHGNSEILLVLLLMTLFLFVVPVAAMFWRVFFIGTVFGTPVERDTRRRGLPVRNSVDPNRHLSRPPGPPRRFSLYSLGSVGSVPSFDDTETHSPPEGFQMSSPETARPRNSRFADDLEAGYADGSPTQESMSGTSSGSCPSTKRLIKSETSKTFTWKGICRKPEATTASLPM